MTESSPPASPDPSPTAAPAAYPGQSVESLSRYLEVHGDRFTAEALARAARDAGYSDADLDQAAGLVRARAAAAPVRTRASLVVLVAYLITFAVLVGGMFSSGYARQYGGHIIGTVILAVLLGVALLISRWWVRSRGQGSDPAQGLAMLLSVPFVLLVVVAGLCIGTGLPVPRGY